MKRQMLIGLVLVAVLAAACAPATAPTTAPATTVPTTAVETVPTQAATAPTSESPGNAPTPDATPEIDIEKVLNPQPEDWKIGPDNAKVTIIEWSDFQCPYCSASAPGLKRLLDEYPNDVQLVYRHFPLPSHDKAQLSAEAAEAAGAQGKFWEMNNLLFEKQEAWSGQTLEEFNKTLSGYAKDLGLDVAKFDQELSSGKYTQKINDARAWAEQLGVPGTPFLLVNQQPWPDGLPSQSYNNLKGLVKFFVELPDMQYDAAPEMTIDKTKSYQATIKTDLGDVVVKLYADKAPIAVNSFVFLAKEGWYDGIPFHRVIADFVAQAGDPSGLGFGGPGYVYPNEVTGIMFDKAGLLAMANAGPGEDGAGTNGSQFFITLGPTPQLDAGDPKTEANYTIFGEVLSGLDIVKKFPVRDPQSAPDVDPAVIQSITIEVK